MKKIMIVFMCLLSIFFVSCNKHPSVQDLTDIDQISEYEYQEVNRINQEILIDTFSLETKSEISINPYVFYENIIYYTIDYSPYYDDPLGENKYTFSKDHNTEIRSYDFETGEDKLLYKYDEERCVSLWEMECNGEYLIWEDSMHDEMWRVLGIKLSEVEEPVELISYQEELGENWNVSIEIEENGICWYDGLYEREHPILIYYYDLGSKEISVIEENLDLYSPYERMVVLDGIYTSYMYDLKNTQIKVMDTKGNDILELIVSGNISNPLYNENICIWMDRTNSEKLFVYHIKEKDLEIIKTNTIFSYSLLQDYVFVNQQGGVLVYDLEQREYTNLIASEDKKRKACLYSIMGTENNVFCEKMNGNTELTEILNFQVK